MRCLWCRRETPNNSLYCSDQCKTWGDMSEGAHRVVSNKTYTRTCSVCGEHFESEFPRSTYCSKDSCQKEKNRRKYSKRPKKKNKPYQRKKEGMINNHNGRLWAPLIAFDGEGVDGRYILLGASDGSYIYNPEGLSTAACVEYLLTKGNRKTAWSFFFGYDANMILRDLDYNQRVALGLRNQIKWHYGYSHYRITFLPGVLFQIEEFDSEDCKGVSTRKVMIYDIGKWVQTKFVTYLRDFKLADEETIHYIETMKDQRSTFTEDMLDEIIKYNTLETQYMVKGAEIIMFMVRRLRLGVRYWYSPGTVAAAAMKSHKVLDHLSVHTKIGPKSFDVTNIIKEDSRFGGRSECRWVGPYDGDLWDADIRSAYPWSLVQIPCLKHGEWVRHENVTREELLKMNDTTLVHVTYLSSHPHWGVVGKRMRDGMIVYPSNMIFPEWRWLVELKPWLRSKYLVDFECYGCYEWVPHCDAHPFDYLSDYYRIRMELKAKGNQEQYIYKLVLNSTYGKTAQQVGNPRFQNFMVAGLCTAYTRMKINQVLTDPNLGEHVLLIATDGMILDKDPSKVLTVGKGLGEWEITPHSKDEKAFFVGPGVYFVGDKERTRGYARQSISLDDWVAAWVADGHNGSVTGTNQRFIGLKLGTKLKDQTLWRTFHSHTFVRSLNLKPRRFYNDPNDPWCSDTHPPNALQLDFIDMRQQQLIDIVSEEAEKNDENYIRAYFDSTILTRNALAEQPDHCITDDDG